MAHWFGKHAINRPMALQATHHSAEVEMKFAKPLLQRLCAAIPSDQAICAFVVRLFNRQRPQAVRRAITERVISTFNRMTRRGSWSHVAIERREIAAPFLIDRDSTSTIVPELRSVRIMATSNHQFPDPIFRQFRQAMRAKASASKRIVQAAARFVVAAGQRATGQLNLVAACASTSPPDLFGDEMCRLLRSTQHGELMKRLSREVVEPHGHIVRYQEQNL